MRAGWNETGAGYGARARAGGVRGMPSGNTGSVGGMPPGSAGTLPAGAWGPGTGARGRAGVPFRLLVPIPSSLAALLLAAGCAMPLPAAEEEPAPAPILPLVQTPPPVPKPAPGEPVETWSVSVEDVPVRELLFALARDAGVDMDIDPGIEDRVTMNAVEEPLPGLIERISRHANLRVEIEDGALVARRDEPVLRTYPIDYVPFARETVTVNEVGTGVGAGAGSRRRAGEGERLRRERDGKGRAPVLGWAGRVGAGGCSARPRTAPRACSRTRETSLIAVRASAAGHREVALLLDRILASARRQVLIEATIIEIDLDDRFRGGVDFSRVFGDFAIESSLLAGNLASPPFAGLSIPDLSLTIRLLSEFGNVRVLSTPLVMALNNQTAIVKIAKNRVFFTSEVRTETSETSVERNVQDQGCTRSRSGSSSS